MTPNIYETSGRTPAPHSHLLWWLHHLTHWSIYFCRWQIHHFKSMRIPINLAVHYYPLRLITSPSIISLAHHSPIFNINQIRTISNIKMAETKEFPPQKIRAIVTEIATLLKEKGESVSVAETVCCISRLFRLRPSSDSRFFGYIFSTSSSNLVNFWGDLTNLGNGVI